MPNVLVISQETSLTNLLQRYLPGEGYNLVVCQPDCDLIEKISEMVYQVIILDIMMPGLEGIKIVLGIRQWVQVPVIMLSTWGTNGDTVRGLDLKSDDYLTGPMNIEQLMLKIKAAISESVILS